MAVDRFTGKAARRVRREVGETHIHPDAGIPPSLGEV